MLEDSPIHSLLWEMKSPEGVCSAISEHVLPFSAICVVDIFGVAQLLYLSERSSHNFDHGVELQDWQ